MFNLDLRNRRIFTAILVISVVSRLAAALWMGDKVVNLPGTFDQISYHNLALRVLGGHGFSFGETWWPITAADAPTAHWSFFYTFYLVFIYTLFGPHPIAARLIQAIIVGILHPLLVMLIGRRLFGETVGLAAAAVTAVYVYFIYYAGTLMTEPFYITAILAALLTIMELTRRLAAPSEPRSKGQVLLLAVTLGLVLGCIVLMRQVFMAFVPFLFLWILLAAGKKRLLASALAAAVSVAVIAAMILPFTLFNYGRFGRMVLLNTNAGYAFFYANHPIYGARFVPILTPEMGTYQDLIPEELRTLDEAALDQELMRRGMQFVFDDPLRYIQLSISRVPAFFMFWPSPESGMVSNISRVGSFGIFWPFMLYGAGLALFHKKYRVALTSPALLILGFAIIYTGIHLLSWALIRYRLPVDAVMIVFAGLALVDLSERARNWLARSRETARQTSASTANHIVKNSAKNQGGTRL